MKKALRELPRGEHSTGRIAKAAGLNDAKTLRRLRELEASGGVRGVGKRWSTEPPPTDLEEAFYGPEGPHEQHQDRAGPIAGRLIAHRH